MKLSEQIKKQDAKAFTHSGKFHADDVFSSALLLYLNPQITITRGNRVPEEYDGIVFDIGRGQYDHHQRDSRVRENGVPYAAFGLLWEELGSGILGETLAQRFDEEFVQPLDNNDNTGEKNELASLIGNFNPVWDETEAADGVTEEERDRGLSVGFLRACRWQGWSSKTSLHAIAQMRARMRKSIRCLPCRRHRAVMRVFWCCRNLFRVRRG